MTCLEVLCEGCFWQLKVQRQLQRLGHGAGVDYGLQFVSCSLSGAKSAPQCSMGAHSGIQVGLECSQDVDGGVNVASFRFPKYTIIIVIIITVEATPFGRRWSGHEGDGEGVGSGSRWW